MLVVAALEAEVAPLRGRVPLCVTGPGKVLAAAGLAHALAGGPPPDVVVNVGSAGATHPGVARGTVLEVGRVVERDTNLAEVLSAVGIHHDAVVPLGVGVTLGTGDTFVGTAEMAALAGRGVDLVDMEAYAYARVCQRFGVPLRCAKVVTDDGSLADWQAALGAAAQLLAGWVRTLPAGVPGSP